MISTTYFANRSLILLLVLANSMMAFGENWLQFRGPTGQGYTEAKNLPIKWGGPKNENVLWKSALVGQGHASPIVWGDSVFVCTVSWATNAIREQVIPDHHLLCYAVADGKLQWDTIIPPGPWLRKDFRSGPGGGYAAPTPTTDGKLVYCAFGSSVIAAVDFKGKIVWRKEIVPYTFDVTVGSSPVLYEDTLIMLCAMSKASDSQVMAFEKATGQVKWQQKFPDMNFAHSTPLIIRVNDQPQLLVLASGMGIAPKALRSLNPNDGKVLWWCKGGGDASSPAYGAGIVYFDSGRGGMGVAVDPTGSGDVTETKTKWTVNQVPEAIGSPTIVDKYVYRLNGSAVLKCWDAATGKTHYSERLEGLSTTWASPIADASGRIFFANAGKSYVLQQGPEFRVLAVNDLGDGSHPSPAVATGRLFLVGAKIVFCIGAQE
jgi:outer membrane protein assembly factor BamB